MTNTTKLAEAELPEPDEAADFAPGAKVYAASTVRALLRAALAATPAAAQWQPIETAPKKGPAVLLFGSRSGRAFVGTWGDYCGFNQPRITHWMPLPAAPGATTGKEPA